MRALLQVADTGPLESLVIMLRSVGYDCYLPSDKIKARLRELGCDTVIDVRHLVENMGYDEPLLLPEMSLREFEEGKLDLYVDVKGHRNGPKIWRAYPFLEKKTLWYRINGGKPEHVVKADGTDCGDECNPPCPVLTPNLRYRDCPVCDGGSYAYYNTPGNLRDAPCSFCQGTGEYPRAYCCWPPFYRQDEYYPVHGRSDKYSNPICLTHNLVGWGYGRLIDPIRELGVSFYGADSPAGLVKHSAVPTLLSHALALVHLKSSDAPGYSIYEACAAACPLVVSRRLIWRNRMQDLLVPGETCLVFDRETHDALSDQDVKDCTREIEDALERLRDPGENQRIGMAARERLLNVMWSERNTEDVASLNRFMERFHAI